MKYPYIALIVSLLTFTSFAAAQTINISASQPSPDGNDISVNLGSVTGEALIWNDRPMNGNTFTTLANSGGWELDSFTFQIFDDDGTITGFKDYRVRVSTIAAPTGDGDASTIPFFDAVGTFSSDAASGDFHTYTFDTPISLNENTQYAISLGVVGSATGWQDGIPSVGTGGDNYAGGQQFTTTSNAAPLDPDAQIDINYGGGDLQFVLGMTAVPEPSTFALIGLAGLGLMLRRR